MEHTEDTAQAKQTDLSQKTCDLLATSLCSQKGDGGIDRGSLGGGGAVCHVPRVRRGLCIPGKHHNRSTADGAAREPFIIG
jgi:hypothetical protein